MCYTIIYETNPAMVSDDEKKIPLSHRIRELKMGHFIFS